MTVDPTKKNDHPDQSVDHLDFNPSCSVGHQGGARTNVFTGETFEPCEDDAVFISKVHGHTSKGTAMDLIHLWCPHHLKEFVRGFKQWIEQSQREGQPYCEKCEQKFHKVSDLIFDLQKLN